MIIKVLNSFSRNRDNINGVLLILIAVCIPFGIFLGNMSLILAGAFNFLTFNIENLKRLKKFEFLFPVLFLFTVILWAVLGSDFKSGMARADRHLIPVILTVILVNQNTAKVNLDKILSYFRFSVVVATLFLIIRSANGWINGEGISQLTFHNFTAFFDQHPVYFSLYIMFSLIYLMSIRLKSLKLIDYLCIFILFIGLILCASKAVIFFGFLIMLGYFIYISRRSAKHIIFSLICLATIVLFLSQISFIKNRFVEGLTIHDNLLEFKPTNDFLEKTQFDYKEKTELTDIELRYLMSTISIYHLTKDGKIFSGYGPADAQDYLDYYLYSYNLGPNWYENFNVHNQFIHILLNYGTIMFLLFVFYLIKMYECSVRNKVYVYMAFLALCSFVFLFEVILIRNKGIIFFYFFNILFLTKNTSFENWHFRNQRYT